jgi:hypothetical protein
MKGDQMSKLRIAIGVGALLCAILAITAPALAAFEAKEAKAKSVTLENKESAIAFRLEEKSETKAEVVCEVIKGEGAVMETSGLNSSVEERDEPASTVNLVADQVGSTVKFEKCSGKVLGVKTTASVNAEKCQMELYDQSESTGKAEATLSLHGIEKGKACSMTVEVAGVCKLELKGAVEGENEALEALKLHNGTEFETEIEAGSTVKHLKTSTGKCEFAEKAEATLNVTKAIKIKGTKLAPPQIIVEGSENKGDIYYFPDTAFGLSSTKTFMWRTGQNNTKIDEIKVENIQGGESFKKGVDGCSGMTYATPTSCSVEYIFAPAGTSLYAAVDTFVFTIGSDPRQELKNLFLGKGT